MFSEEFRASLLEFMQSLELNNLDAYENVVVKAESNKKNLCVPLVCLTDCMVYMFIQTNFGLELSAQEREKLLSSLNAYETALISQLEIWPERVMVFAVNDHDLDEMVVYHRPSFSNNLMLLNNVNQGTFAALQDLIATQESYFQRLAISGEALPRSSNANNPDFFKSISRKLDFSSDDREKIKYDLDGNAYVRKRNNCWAPASAIDGTNLFYFTTLGGFLGAHLFYQNKKSKGVFYLFTCGFFGIGWIFDAIELLLGVYRDKDGYYIIPPKLNFLYIILCFAIGLVFTFVGGLLYKLLFSLSNNFLKNLGEAFASEWSSSQ